MKRVVIVMLVAACGDDGGSTRTDAAVDTSTGCEPTATVFLNRMGGSYTPGPDDATMNTAGVFDAPRTLPAWPHDNWDALKTCVTAALAPFRITITEVDPGSAPHHEIIFTTQYWGTGGSGIGSISQYTCMNVPTNTLTFVFGIFGAAAVDDTCDTAVSQFASATVSLDHVTDCRDFLGVYQPRCGARQFLDEAVTCGEGTPRACQCGGTTQSSLPVMVAKFGASCAP